MTAPTLSMTRRVTWPLVRTIGRRGWATVHLPDCRMLERAAKVVPWRWAKGRPVLEVFQYDWNRPCRVCWPALPPAQKGSRAADV